MVTEKIVTCTFQFKMSLEQNERLSLKKFIDHHGNTQLSIILTKPLLRSEALKRVRDFGHLMLKPAFHVSDSVQGRVTVSQSPLPANSIPKSGRAIKGKCLN